MWHNTVIPLTVKSCVYVKAKQPESGDLCGNITEFGVAEEHLSLQGDSDLPPPQMKWYCHTVHQTKVVLFLYSTV